MAAATLPSLAVDWFRWYLDATPGTSCDNPSCSCNCRACSRHQSTSPMAGRSAPYSARHFSAVSANFLSESGRIVPAILWSTMLSSSPFLSRFVAHSARFTMSGGSVGSMTGRAQSTSSNTTPKDVPLYTFPNPPTPITLPSSNPHVASCIAANGNRYPAPALCPSLTTTVLFRVPLLLLLPKLPREREREPSAVAEKGAQVLDDGFFFFLRRRTLTTRSARAITAVTPAMAEPATIAAMTFFERIRDEGSPAPASVLPTSLMISRPLRRPSGSTVPSVDGPTLTVILLLVTSLALSTKSLYSGVASAPKLSL
nr:unnamed protein product [Digitaria exilis]